MTPIEVISLGAGVQSSTMSLMAAEGDITPMPVGGIFADTKGEPASVYKWLKWLRKQLPFPVYYVSAGSLAAASLAMHETHDGRLYSKTNIPFFTRNHNGSQGKIKFRGCTRDFKLVPLKQKQRELVEDHLPTWRKRHKEDLRDINALKRWIAAQKAKQSADDLAEPLTRANSFVVPRENLGLLPLVLREKKEHEHRSPPPNMLARSIAAWKSCQSDPLVISWVGISLDEASRMKDSRDPWIVQRFPLIEKRMTRQDCLRWMEAHGYPEPPRSACVYCPFHNDEEWRRLRDEEPKDFAKAVRFERAVQKAKAASANFRTVPFLHRQLVPLTRVDFRSEAEMGQLNFFENDCSGLCGT